MRNAITISLLLLLPSLSFADCNNTMPPSCPPPHGQNSSGYTIQNTPKGLEQAMNMMTDVMAQTTHVAATNAYVSPGSSYCESLSGTGECKQPGQQQTMSAGDNDTEVYDPYKDVDQ